MNCWRLKLQSRIGRLSTLAATGDTWGPSCSLRAVDVAAPCPERIGDRLAALGFTIPGDEADDIDALERLLEASAARCSNYLGYSRTLLVT